jgi:hypothetical protein
VSLPTRKRLVKSVTGLGLILLVLGIIFYIFYWVGGTSQSQSGSSGFYFAIQPNDEQRIWSISYGVYIDPEQNDIWIQVSFTGNATKETDYHLAIFTPYKISSLKVTKTKPQTIPISWEFKNAKSGSIVYATFSLTGDSYETPTSRIKLDLATSLVSRNFGSYTLDMPFGSTPSLDVHELLDDFPIGFSEHSFSLSLTVNLAENARLTYESEEINDIRFNKNSKTVEFNISELRRFVLQYDKQNEINRFQSLVFLGGIFIGSGISAIVSETGLRGLERLYRFLRKYAKRIKIRD